MSNTSFISLFTIPKPFIGKTKIAQINSIRSWMQYVPQSQIFLCGNDKGVDLVAREFNLCHIPDIPVNDFGTPRLDEAFRIVQKRSTSKYIGYLNGDIILLSNPEMVLGNLPFERFLVTGRRINADVSELIDFSDGNNIKTLLEEVTDIGVMDWFTAMDYFIFPRGQLDTMPPFVVGRAGWDNWMIAFHKNQNIPVIDATAMIMAVHQNHDYFHVRKSSGRRWEGPESVKNCSYYIMKDAYRCILDADFLAITEGISPRFPDNQVRKQKIRRAVYPIIPSACMNLAGLLWDRIKGIRTRIIQ